MKDNKSILSRWNKKCAHTKQSLSHREPGVESREVFSSFFSPLLQTHYNSVFCCVIEEKTSFCEQYIAYAHVSNMSNWSFCEFKHVEWLSCWLAYRIDVCVCVWVFVCVFERESNGWGSLHSIDVLRQYSVCLFNILCNRRIKVHAQLHSTQHASDRIHILRAKLACDSAPMQYIDGHVNESMTVHTKWNKSGAHDLVRYKRIHKSYHMLMILEHNFRFKNVCYQIWHYLCADSYLILIRNVKHAFAFRRMVNLVDGQIL